MYAVSYVFNTAKIADFSDINYRTHGMTGTGKMQKTPKGLRVQIGIFGRRNAGKSSLLNALTGQSVSIVSAVPGTTADPVEKAMELLPLGPVLLIDTAGVDDDAGELGALRADRSRKILERTDLALLVTDGVWSRWEEELSASFPFIH